MKVVIAGKYPIGTLEAFKKQLPEDRFELRLIEDLEVYNSLEDAECIVLRIFKATEEVIEKNRDLKMICRWGAGYDTVDIKAAGRRGVLVTNTPGANAYSVSEVTILLMLAVGHKLLEHVKCMQNGVWSKLLFEGSTVTLNNKLVGLIGCGNIGRQVAQKVQVFGARTQYTDMVRLDEETEKRLNMTYVSLEELLRTSDVVSLHVPLTEKTRHMIDTRSIAMMKQGSIIINTARGGLVDEAALVEAVCSGHLRGAGIDCVEQEPLLPENPILSCPNIIVTPHIGGTASDIADIMIPMISEDIRRLADGKEVLHVVNREYLVNKL